MRFMTLIVSLLILTSFSKQAQASQDSILGTWESDEKDVRMEFFKEGDVYEGRLLWGNKIVEEDGKTSKKDLRNPDRALQSREIVGVVSLTGLKWSGREYTGGKIYDPPSGKTYDCKAWVEADKLHLRGFMGFSMMGKTVLWHRYPPSR